WEVRLYDHTWYLGALEYVLRPFNGLPVDPSEATPENCEVAHYCPGSANSYEIEHYVGDNYTGDLIFLESIAGGSFGCLSSQMEAQSEQRINFNYDGKPDGTYTMRGTEDLGKGLAG